MALKEIIKKDLMAAQKEGQEVVVSTLRLLLASLLNKEKEKRYQVSQEEPGLSEEELIQKSGLSEEEVLAAIFSSAKKRKEAILEFAKGKRQDLVTKETVELKILEKYLPALMSEEEIEKEARQVIEALAVKDVKETGRVMSQLMAKLKGKADGQLVATVVKRLLSG